MDLVAAIRTCITDDELQFLTSILYKLPFESSLFRFCGPGEAFIYIKKPIKAKRESNQSPTHSLPDLKKSTRKNKLHNHHLGMMLTPNNGGIALIFGANENEPDR